MTFRPLLALALAVALALTTSATEAANPTTSPGASAKAALAKKGKKKHSHIHHGVVESVEKGMLVIKVHHHKRGTKKEGGKDEAFKLTASTKFEKHGQPGSASELHRGEHVIVVAKDHMAEKVDIVHHKHKKKAKKK